MGAVAGQPFILTLNFRDLATGALADPAAVTLDITYGGEVGLVPDFAGPFTWSGASAPAPGQVWRVSAGVFQFSWSVPASASAGTYTANWTCLYSGKNSLGVENFYVAGAAFPQGAPSDVGFWTGSIDYVPDTSQNLAVYSGASVPLGAVDGNGIAWLLQKVEGWDGADIQGAGVIPKSGDHGGWASPQFYGPRTITLTITAMAPSQALRDKARSALAAAVPVSDLASFTYGEAVPKTVMVRRSGKIAEKYPDLLSVTFSVVLVAPDPRKYAAVRKVTGPVSPLPLTALGFTSPFTLPVSSPGQTPGGVVAVTNDGDFETRPLITVKGPVAGPALANVQTGQAVSWSTLVLGPSDQMTVDFSARQALLNGAYRPADLDSSWWVLPPGTTTIQFSGQSDTGASFDVSFADAYQ